MQTTISMEASSILPRATLPSRKSRICRTEAEEAKSHGKRVTLKVERTPEELAELKAERERFPSERPGMDELIASGDYEGPGRQGDLMALLSAIAELKRQRDERGLGLADVSQRSGLDRLLLSRLENGMVLNPTMATLWRYADAIRSQISLAVVPLLIGTDS
jgi:hypothetical protein